MARLVLVPINRPDVAPLAITERLRHQLVYFMTAWDTPGIPTLSDLEYWFAPDEVATWVDDGVFRLVSPLDTDSMTEVELSEEQENFLQWLQANAINHLRLEER